jgi:hypothetical protein
VHCPAWLCAVTNRSLVTNVPEPRIPAYLPVPPLITKVPRWVSVAQAGGHIEAVRLAVGDVPEAERPVGEDDGVNVAARTVVAAGGDGPGGYGAQALGGRPGAQNVQMLGPGAVAPAGCGGTRGAEDRGCADHDAADGQLGAHVGLRNFPALGRESPASGCSDQDTAVGGAGRRGGFPGGFPAGKMGR